MESNVEGPQVNVSDTENPTKFWKQFSQQWNLVTAQIPGYTFKFYTTVIQPFFNLKVIYGV